MPNCDICGEPSNGFECDWPVEKFVGRSGCYLRIGDVIARYDHATGKRETKGIARVVWIDRPVHGSLLMKVTVSIVWPWKETVRKITVQTSHDFMVKESTFCGAHVCDACMIERDADKMVICKKHWDAWQAVA